MFEQAPEQGSVAGSVFRTLGGFFAGLMAGVLVPVAVFSMVVPVLASVAPMAGMWVAEILNLAVLFFVGYLAYQKMHESPGARGMLTGISIAFLLNAICGVGMLTAG
jgi:hypothetical protein